MRIALVIGILVGSTMLLPRMVSTREHAREVRLVVRGMTYYVDGADVPNPALRFLPGEQVRVSVRNEDRGMVHDFRIPAWDVDTGTLEWQKETSVTFRVPGNASSVSYVCTPHSAMMSGRVVVDE